VKFDRKILATLFHSSAFKYNSIATAKIQVDQNKFRKFVLIFSPQTSIFSSTSHRATF